MEFHVIKVKVRTEPYRDALVPVWQIDRIVDQGYNRVIYLKSSNYVTTEESIDVLETKLKNL